MADVAHERGRDREQDALLDADRRHRDRGEQSQKEFAPAFAVDVAETLNVDHADGEDHIPDCRNTTHQHIQPGNAAQVLGCRGGLYLEVLASGAQ